MTGKKPIPDDLMIRKFPAAKEWIYGEDGRPCCTAFTPAPAEQQQEK